MLQGQTASHWRETGGVRHPCFRMPLPQKDWLERAQAALIACTNDMRSRLPDAAWCQLPVFFASSSFQIGLHEQAGEPHAFPPAAGHFAARCLRWLGLGVVPQCFSNACTSSMMALDAAACWLAQGIVPHALVIATEFDNRLTASGFHSLGLLSSDACRPFAANRSGFVLGEAVAAVLLTTDPVLARPVRWRLSACASGTDAYSLTGPDPAGGPIAAVIGAALQSASISAQDIGLVKLHAAGVGTTDTAEAHALLQVFGNQPPPLLSLKPYLGHTLGASGLAELSALLACLEQGHIPATPGCAQPDAALGGLVPARKRQALAPQHVLLLGLGFGGSVAAAIVSREQA